MRRPTTGSPGPCAMPSPTGATASGTHRRRSPSPHASGGAGDGRTPPSQAIDARGWGRDSAAGQPPQQGRAPRPRAQPPPPPPYGAAEGRASPTVGERAGATSAEGGPLPRSPLPANRCPPRPTGTTRRQRGERGARVKACTTVWHPKCVGGQGKSAPPPSAAGSPGPEPPGRPPATARGRRQGTREGLRGTPPLPTPPLPPPLPLRPAAVRRPAREAAAPHPPREGRGAQGRMPQPRRAQLRAECPPSAAHSLLQCPQPTGSPAPALKGPSRAAAGRRHPGMQHGGRGTDEATRLVARPGKAGEQTAAKRPPRHPPRGAPRTSPRGYGALATPPPLPG